ncbi:MAG: porin family protein [Bacteroidales bacterium]|nr:porin family protein [Bacteroidales bacterium]
MKKLITITSLFLLLALVVNAQTSTTDSRERIQIGVKAGLSYSNVYDTEGEEFDADAKFGFTGGAFLIVPIGKFLGIQPEILVTQKGFKGSGNLLGAPYSFKRTTTFLEIPILLAVRPSEMITLVAGPQYSYLMYERYEFTSSIVNIDQEEKFEQDNIRKNMFGFVGGVDINLSPIVLSARVGWDIQNNKGDGTSSTPRYKDFCSQITIGFKF